jgi:aryl-alcohol dehydrogenase-like predicted oxidoreductase
LSKLVLGTAQFGFDYGIHNKLGKIPRKAAFEIIDFAAAHGVDMLDTAPAYGDSESVLGDYIGTRSSAFKVISKLPAGVEDGKALEESLKKLHIGSLYGYLVHDFDSFVHKPAIWTNLVQFKERGIVRKIGFSLYFPRDLETLEKRGVVPDLVQVPYSLFDQRFAASFPTIKAKGIEIHVRSVFLQGLVFQKGEELADRFLKIKPKLAALKELSRRSGVSISGLCLNFALLNPHVDRAVIGVDSLDNLKENLENIHKIAVIQAIYNELEDLREEDDNIILPFLWGKQ